MYQNILTVVEGATQIITINRPDKLNALNQATIKEINDAVAKGIANPDVKGMILTGSGEKAFVAGADITEFNGMNKESGATLAQNGHNILFGIERSPKPVVAAINGFALGGGCELAMACHLRVAATNAKFGQPEVNLGLIPGYGGTQRLVELIGKGRALELLMTADMVDAQKALSYGLVNAVAEPAELMNTAKAMLEKIYTKAPLAIAAVIKSVNAIFTEGQDGYKTEVAEFAALGETQDFVEGTTAFVEKRKANFIGQ